MATETSLENLVRANQVDMTKNTSGSNPPVSSGSFSGEPTIQLLQRGFIIGSENGGPVDVTEVVDGINSLNELTTLFKESGGLYYGKKVYVKGMKAFYYYSHMNNTGSENDDAWKIIN